MGGGGGGGGKGMSMETEPLCNIHTLRTILCTKLICAVHCYHRSQRYTSESHLLKIFHFLPGNWPKLTRITNLWKSLSTGTIGYPMIEPIRWRRQVGYTYVHLCFGECSVFAPVTVFAFLFNPSVIRTLRTSYQSHTQDIKSQIGVWITV